MMEGKLEEINREENVFCLFLLDEYFSGPVIGSDDMGLLLSISLILVLDFFFSLLQIIFVSSLSHSLTLHSLTLLQHAHSDHAYNAIKHMKIASNALQALTPCSVVCACVSSRFR